MPTWTEIPDTAVEPQSELLDSVLEDVTDNAAYANVEMKVKAANEGVTNSAVLQDDDHITMTMGGAGSIWAFEAGISFDTTIAAGFKFRLDHADKTAGWMHYVVYRERVIVTNVEEAATGSTTNTYGITVGASTFYSIRIRGYIRVNATDTFKLEWAQNAATPAVMTTVYVEATHLIAHRVDW